MVCTQIDRDHIPGYVAFLHKASKDGQADSYAKGNIAGFIIREQDTVILPALEEVEQVFLVYTPREGA